MSAYLPLRVPAQIHPPSHGPMRWLLWFLREYQICPAQLQWTSPGPYPGVTLTLERQSIWPSSYHDLFVFATLLKASQEPLSRLLIMIFLSRDPLSSVIFVTGYFVESAMYKYDMFKLYIAYYKISYGLFFFQSTFYYSHVSSITRTPVSGCLGSKSSSNIYSLCNLEQIT